MAAENDPSARSLPLRVLGPAAGMAVALSLVVIALWRFAPGLLPALALLLALGVALLWGRALAARSQGRGARPSRPPEPPAAAVSPGPVPANVHSIIRDPLTGLFHRRYFEASVEREIHRMERRSLPLGIVLMRVDQEASDEVLKAIGALLSRRVRGGDVASHHGGGTFGLILPEAPLEGVRTRAEQLREAVRETGVTFSLGVAAFPDCGHSSEKLLRAVRTALDEARAEGGDGVAVAPGAVLDRRLMLPD